eukprot:4285631-Amphidinium_carterae.1
MSLLGDSFASQGALDKVFGLAFITEGVVLLVSTKLASSLTVASDMRVSLRMLEEFALESSYPLYVLNVVFNMYNGNRRILVQDAISEGVQTTCGFPPGCGRAVDLLHAFLIHSLRCAGKLSRLPPVQITTGGVVVLEWTRSGLRGATLGPCRAKAHQFCQFCQGP